mmetsp:Transcript_73700/g.225427  ORF Transcript_73700/g.225427 Transcript_73700/m.225427 type:complete len:202 (+) Transcript_73700:187-792(+)
MAGSLTRPATSGARGRKFTKHTEFAVSNTKGPSWSSGILLPGSSVFKSMSNRKANDANNAEICARACISPVHRLRPCPKTVISRSNSILLASCGSVYRCGQKLAALGKYFSSLCTASAYRKIVAPLGILNPWNSISTSACRNVSFDGMSLCNRTASVMHALVSLKSRRSSSSSDRTVAPSPFVASFASTSARTPANSAGSS